MEFAFSAPTHIAFGPGSARLVGERLAELGATRAVIVTDQGVRAAGLLEAIVRDCSRTADIAIFDEIEPNPRDMTVHRLAEFLGQHRAQAMVVVGGGSPIDAAKAAGVIVANGGTVLDHAGRNRFAHSIMPLVAIPTTAGTGSEVSFSAVITDSNNKTKISITSRRAAAAFALVDPELTITLPPQLTAATGMDALTHAIEALTATCTNPFSQTLALEAISLVGQHLREAVADGNNLDARTGMMLASTMAGVAFANSDVGAVHCMAEALGGVYDLGHGVANSMCLPVVMRYNLAAAPREYARVAKRLGAAANTPVEQAAEQAVTLVAEMRRELGIPRASSMGIRHEDVNRLASLAVNNGSTSSNRRSIDHQAFVDLFEQLLWD